MSEENNESLVPVPPNAADVLGQGMTLDGLLFRHGTQAVCSFDLTKPEGRELMQKCEEQPDQAVRELVNLEFKLRHVYARMVDYSNPDTSEVYPIMRICLVTTDGTVHPCASEGIRDSIVRLMQGHGLPPWKDGIPVRVVLKTLKNSRQRLTLLEVFPPKKGGKS